MNSGTCDSFQKQRMDDTYTVVLDIPDKEREQIKKLAVSQALETIRNRIDQFGVAEPDITAPG